MNAETQSNSDAEAKPLKVKICGVREVEMALHAAGCGADFLGLVFVEGSPRYVLDETASAVCAALREAHPAVGRVGLFVDASVERVLSAVAFCGLSVVQLHGGESAVFVVELRGRLPSGVAVWKALPFDAAAMDAWRGAAGVDVLLLDAPHVAGELSGGTGRTLDWSALSGLDLAGLPPVMLAGGLTPANVGEAIAAVGSGRLFGVDVSSGVESSRGVKDAAKVAAFCAAVRKAVGR